MTTQTPPPAGRRGPKVVLPLAAQTQAFEECERFEKLRRRYGTTAMLQAQTSAELTPGRPDLDADHLSGKPMPGPAELNDWQHRMNNIRRCTGDAGEYEPTAENDRYLHDERWPLPADDCD